MRQILRDLLFSTARSVLIALILFLITWAAVTGEFPPDFERVSKSYERLQNLNLVARVDALEKEVRALRHDLEKKKN